MSAIYALMCGLSIYMAVIAAFGHRLMGNRWARVMGNLGLALAFAMLALSTSGIVHHGTHRTLTRIGFTFYALSLIVIIAEYWLVTWRARKM